jgi:hypothetical protein
MVTVIIILYLVIAFLEKKACQKLLTDLFKSQALFATGPPPPAIGH